MSVLAAVKVTAAVMTVRGIPAVMMTVRRVPAALTATVVTSSPSVTKSVSAATVLPVTDA